MSAAGQTLVGGHQLKFYDAPGTLKATFTFPAGVINGSAGDSILVATQEFDAVSTGGNADFTFTLGNTASNNGGDALHPVQGPSGKVTFSEGLTTCVLGGPAVVDSVAFGAFAGSVDYGSAAAALPSPSNDRALRLGNLNFEATDNSAEYSLQAVSPSTFTVPVGNLTTNQAIPRNNARTVLELPQPAPTATPLPVGGIAELPEVAGEALEAEGSSGLAAGALAAIVAGAVAGALAVGAAASYAKKRQSTNVR